MKLTFNGTRGSIPHGLSSNNIKTNCLEILKNYDAKIHKDPESYLNTVDPIKSFGLGFHTTNVMIESQIEKSFLLVDCGTGIMSSIGNILSGYDGSFEINILITHFHWDHLMGLNFFAPIFMPGRTINFISPDENLEKMIKALFSKPNFPVPFDQLPSKISFIQVPERKVIKIGSFDIEFYKMDHPDPCWGPKITENGKVYAHAIDTEAVRITKKELGEDSKFYENIDLLHFDAPYLESEINGFKKGWGHSSTVRAFKLAEEFSIPSITFGHYTPEVDYKKFTTIRDETKLAFNELNPGIKRDLDYFFSYDGMEIVL